MAFSKDVILNIFIVIWKISPGFTINYHLFHSWILHWYLSVGSKRTREPRCFNRAALIVLAEFTPWKILVACQYTVANSCDTPL